ncbi:Dehydrogenase/reductase SDR family member [Ooceraea biroi]|uniref:Dehydrogenase/reductase SDR family member n=1 Tax=Ooceraea biroi TaxID=2015173 RepID=A0A026WVU2_OOCBI|nr:Dehydrogenase/reductase SDR family member [Ooceraea biroi]
MDRWEGKVVLVTGASAGIGAAIARELAKNGMKVIAVARRLEKLQELAANIKGEYKADIYPMQCDVQKEEDILRVFKWANEKLGGVDVLVNNAGVVYTDPIIESSTQHYQNIMNINVIAAAICSRELVKSIKQRNASGHIINISSIAGHYAELITEPVNLYSASKYALTGMAASLRHEVAKSNLNIKVTNISPGAVETDMLLNNYPQLKEINIPMILSKDIADTVVYVLGTPQQVQVCEMIVLPHKVSHNPLSFK